MLTPKQRAYLRSLAQKKKAVLQIGKEGLNVNIRNDALNYLAKYELLKVSILKNSLTTAEETIAYFSLSDIEFVHKIGRVLVFYKPSDKAVDPILLPLKSN